ncbi:hypothetical protein BBP40_004017 [Aspergillus hancockii]|nr:hypothetical protein BBP40_004017 [Aspergillus hancockii]
MATQIHVQHVEMVINYTFRSKSLIFQALTAAGADKENYDGYRQLSQIGASLVELLLAIIVYGTGIDRRGTANLRREFVDKNHYSLAAKQTGIDRCIRRNERTAAESPEVHRKAINAIISAVLLDSWDVRAALCATLRIFIDGNNGPRLRMLPATPSSTMEFLPTILHAVLARDTGTVDPTMLFGPSVGGDFTHPIVYTLFDQSNLVFLASSQTNQSTGSASETPVTSPEIDMFWCLDDQAIYQDTASETNFVSSSPSAWTCITGPNTEATPATPTQEKEQDRIVSRCQAEHAESNMTRTARQSKKIAGPSERTRIQRMIHDFLAQERKKRMAEKLAPPEDEYLRPEVQGQVIALENGFLAALLMKIGGPQQIIALREIICKGRAQKDIPSFLFEEGMMPVKKRLRIIFELDTKLAATQLFRWYHIFKLFEDCGGREALSFSGNMNTTPATFNTEKQGRGNPVHRADALVANAMVLEYFPGMPSNSDDFKSILKVMKQIRKLGKRLHMLVERFGMGILGLMFNLNTRNDTMATADRRLLDPKETEFTTFVNILDSTQGELLRNVSNSIMPLLSAFLHGTLDCQEPFPLETVDPSTILGLAKGSPSLLRLIQNGDVTRMTKLWDQP